MKPSQATRQRERLAQLTLLSTFEKPLEKKVARIIAKQGASAAAYYRDHRKVTYQTLAAHKMDFQKVLIPFYTRVITAFAARIRRSVKSTDTFTDVMKQWLIKRALETVEDIDETTLDIIKTAISHGVEQGWTTEKIAQSISDATLYEVNQPRARVIARTEMHTAAQEGQLQAAKATGIQGLQKTWTASGDNRTRDDHAEADGQTVDIDDDFIVGGESMSRPGDGSAEESINCRCVCVFSRGNRDDT